MMLIDKLGGEAFHISNHIRQRDFGIVIKKYMHMVFYASYFQRIRTMIAQSRCKIRI